jgi:hypothetical protein
MAAQQLSSSVVTFPTKPIEGIQDREVSFPRAVLLDALALGSQRSVLGLHAA